MMSPSEVFYTQWGHWTTEPAGPKINDNISYLQLLPALSVDLLHELIHQGAFRVWMLPQLSRDGDLALHFEQVPIYCPVTAGKRNLKNTNG
jgi:hypothetical protein